VQYGITGHRSLPPTIVERAVAHWGRVLPTGAQLHGVSSLAEGADQLFASHVLAAGGSLEAILPCADYATSLTTEEGRRGLVELQRAAETITTLPFRQPSAEAYLAAGHAMVDRCDHLFAIWDGLPARGLGGTADVVAYARALGRPVTVLWVAGILRS